MEFLSDLWQPIVVAAVLVFLVSSVVHMALQVHKSDFKPLPNEAKVLEALRANGLGPGDYMFPHCGSMKEMGSPETLAKLKLGPVGSMTLRPNGPPALGKALLQWFLFSLLVSVFTAYAAAQVLPAGESYLTVFRLTGAIALMGYGFGPLVDSIWKGIAWSTSLKFLFDGLLYALATAGAFGWLWPEMKI